MSKKQKQLWDLLLELRIKLQRSLTDANKLPQADIYTDFNKNDEIKTAFTEATEELDGLVNDLMEFSNTMRDANPVIPKAQEPESKSNDIIDNWWHRIETSLDCFEPYQNEVIDRWNQRTQLIAGMKNKQLKALNQSILNQVNKILSEKVRLIKRTQLKRTPYTVIGKKKKEQPIADQSIKQPTAAQEEYDESIFDDTDFYQQLLRELIENGLASIDPSDNLALSKHYLATKKLRIKMHKNVDRRSSKGRKIKYEVQQKLVNFMVPLPVTTSNISEELFANLFGKMNQ